MSKDITPFRISEHFSLSLTELDEAAEVFEECGYDGGSYGWHGVADALIRLKAPHLADKLEFDPEASMFAAYGPDRNALEELAVLLKSAMNDHALLKMAIENADPELMY